MPVSIPYWGTTTATTTATTSMIYSNQTVWPLWNQTYVTGGTFSTTTTVWTAWSGIYRPTSSWAPQMAPLVATPEQDAQVARVVEHKRVAQERAKELLLAHLDAGQKRDVLEHAWFEVLSNKGRRWRIRMESIVGNVDLLPEEGEVRLASYCAHGAGSLPKPDHFLAQKLVLETDEESFLRVANCHYRAA